jgi:hypothetical protein
MKAAILCMFFACVLGANLRATMTSQFNTVDEVANFLLEHEKQLWLPYEPRPGMNEEDIHKILLEYQGAGYPVPEEMLNTNEYVPRFDANQDGL